MRKLLRWDDELSREEGLNFTLELALWECQGIEDDQTKNQIEQFLLSSDFEGLMSFDIPYTETSLADAAHVRQVLSLYSKRTDIELGVDRAAVALDKFLKSEEKCKETNTIFKLRSLGQFQLLPRHERVLWHAARKIRSILGEVPTLSELKLRFGPGATTQIPKRMASARAKLGTNPACSSELFPLGTLVLNEMPLWRDLLSEGLAEGASPLVLHHGKLAFVPKSAKEDRTVMVEPSLNTMCQAGIGSYMAGRLRRAGVDIRDQTRNQKLARKGSLDGSLATVDLSSASDTVATELVFDLLGVDWGTFLSHFRTGSVEVKGSVIRLEKFSSMGNGYTFPLETVIFYALAYGCCLELELPLHDVSAYGDDIIIPSDGCSLLYEVLTACGFTPNAKKSYSSGPFRESCGADYFQGIDIRPVYLKGDRILAADLFRLHNFYSRKFEFEVCEHILSYLDTSIQLFGPDGYGDGHLIGNWVPRRKKSHLRSGYGGYVFDTFTWKPRRSFWTYKGDRVLPAYSTYLREGAEDDGSEVAAEWDGDNFSVVLPGTRGVNRISIYVLTH